MPRRTATATIEPRPLPERAVTARDIPLEDVPDFLALHGMTLGGSSVGAVLGLNGYQTALDVWNGLMGIVPRERTRRRQNPLDRGHAMEPIIAQLYTAETGREVTGDGATRIPHWREEFRNILHATPDRIIIPLPQGPEATRVSGMPTPYVRTSLDEVPQRGVFLPGPGGHVSLPPDNEIAWTSGILEIKCLGQRTFLDTKQNGVDPSYYAQLQLYLDVMVADWGSFAIFNPEDWELWWFDVERNQPFIDAMLARVMDFWQRCVLTRTPPSDGRTSIPAQIQRALPSRTGADLVQVTDPRAAAYLANLKTARESKELAEHAYEQQVAAVKAYMTELGQDGIVVPGVGNVRWRPQVTRRLDKDLLLAAYPDLPVDEFMKETVTQPFVPRFDR